MKIIFMASGNGTNFEHLAKNIQHEKILITNKECNAINRAKKLNIKTKMIDNNQELFDYLQLQKPDLILLCGYLKIIKPDIVKEYKEKIVNIHPSLLPKYTGLHAFERSYENEEILGCTLHYVDEGLDTGKIINQKKFLKKDLTKENAEKLLHKLEHELYLEEINKIIENKKNNKKH